MSEEQAALTKLVEALNEGNVSLRRDLLEECWAANGRLLRDGELLAGTREELEAQVAREREDPQFFVKIIRSVQRARDLEWAHWQVRSLNQPPGVQQIMARRSEDGRLQEVTATSTAASPASGKLVTRLQEAVIANPIPALGLLGGVLYLALRIPVGLFYDDLGVTPDEVGFGPQVLVPQSLTLLGLFVVVMLASYGVGVSGLPAFRAGQAASRLKRQGQRRRANLIIGILVIGGICGFVCAVFLTPLMYGFLFDWAIGGAPLIQVGIGISIAGLAVSGIHWVAEEIRELKDQGRRSRRVLEGVKAFSLLVGIYGAAGLLIALPIWAVIDADRVRSGGAAGGRLSPWRALPVQLRWKDASHVHLNNTCHLLRYLGEANGQMVVFDTRLDKAFRIPVSDASAAVDRKCRMTRSPRN
jgi:hypothetical protein